MAPIDLKEALGSEFDWSNGDSQNLALVFVKPHANNDAVTAFVRTELEGKGCKVLAEGDVGAEEIAEKDLIGKHYAAIATNAMADEPSAPYRDDGELLTAKVR